MSQGHKDRIFFYTYNSHLQPPSPAAMVLKQDIYRKRKQVASSFHEQELRNKYSKISCLLFLSFLFLTDDLNTVPCVKHAF